MSSGGPDEWGVGAVGVVTVGVAPRVDEVWVGISRAADHRRFGFEVALVRWREIVLVGTEETGEENLAGAGVAGWVNSRGRCRGIRGIKVVVGVVAVTSGLQGSDFSFRGGGSSVTANRARSTQGKACEDADDGDDSEEFDQGEGRLLTQRTQRTQRSERGDFIWECEMRNLEFEKRER